MATTYVNLETPVEGDLGESLTKILFPCTTITELLLNLRHLGPPLPLPEIGTKEFWSNPGTKTRLCVRTIKGNSDALVLVPGFGLPSLLWSSLVSSLDRDETVYLIDSRGSGESSGAYFSANDFELWVRDYDFLIEKIKDKHDSVTVISQSLNGLVSYLSSFEVAIDKLVLISPLFSLYNQSPSVSLAMNLIRLGLGKIPVLGNLYSITFSGDSRVLTTEILRGRHLLGSEYFIAMNHLASIGRQIIQRDGVNQPTLIQVGSFDTVVDSSVTIKAFKGIVGSEIEIFRGGRHESAFSPSHVQTYADRISQFLE